MDSNVTPWFERSRPSGTAPFRSALLVLLAALVTSTAGPPAHAVELDLRSYLDEPGARVVVVDFYAPWCKPCMDSVPKWEKLRKKHARDGLRLVAVNHRPGTPGCPSLPWTPHDQICDLEGEIGDALGVQSLPTAFAWSWQGDLLAQGDVSDIRAAVLAYLDVAPRVAVDAFDAAGAPDKGLRRMVEAELSQGGKLQVVASDRTRKKIRSLQTRSHRPSARDSQQCELGAEMSANHLLRAEVADGRLSLLLIDVERRCQRTAVARWDSTKPAHAVATAVHRLVEQLRAAPALPGGARSRRGYRVAGKSASNPWRGPITQVKKGAAAGRLYLRVDVAGVKYTIRPGRQAGVLQKDQLVELRLALAQRPYNVVLSKKGYETFEAPIAITSDTRVQTLDHVMQPEVKLSAGTDVGILDVSSVPSNAKILVDGVEQSSRTPVSLDVRAGRHTVEVLRKAHRSWVDSVEVGPGGIARVVARLVPDFGELSIEVAQPDATIFLDGKPVGVQRYREARQRAGGYALRIEAPLHHPHEGTVFVERGGAISRAFDLRRAYGSVELTVRTVVDDGGGAVPRVFIDGEPVEAHFQREALGRGVAFTALIDRVPSGDRELEVQLGNYESWVREVDIRDGVSKAVDAVLGARFGMVTVRPTPAHAEVVVDGAPVGTGVISIPLAVGSHRVEVRSEPGWRPWVKAINVTKGAGLTLVANLLERVGALTIATTPPGATILVDGVEIGVSPVQAPGLQVGTRSVEARMEGFTPTRARFQVREGATEVVRVVLQQLGNVDIACLTNGEDAGDVEVELAGRVLAGPTAHFGSVASGRHTVTCRSSEGYEASGTVDAAPGLEARLDIELVKPENRTSWSAMPLIGYCDGTWPGKKWGWGLAYHCDDGTARGLQITWGYGRAEDRMVGVQLGLMLSLADHVEGVQLSPIAWADDSVEGVQLGVLAVSDGDVEGLQLGLGWNHIDNDLEGVQVGVVNVTNEDVEGGQIGLVNVAGDESYHHLGGWQLGAVNVALGNLHGLQLGMVNYAGERADTVQLAFVGNVVSERIRGTQLSFLFNWAGDDMVGVQVSFLLNLVDDDLSGSQVGPVNIVGGDLKGVQIGVVNWVSGDLKGVQIGMMNITGRDLYGLQLGAFNFAFRHGLPYMIGLNMGW